MVEPRLEEVIQSDQILAEWSFSGVCLPSEIVRHSIANTVQTMITLTNLSESIEQLKKDKKDTCRALMSEIDTVHGERNNCKTELEQLKSSSCTKINQLRAEIDRLQKSHAAEVEQLKADAEADRLQTLEEEGDILNNTFFQVCNHNRSTDLTFLNGRVKSLLEACEQRLVDEESSSVCTSLVQPGNGDVSRPKDLATSTSADPLAALGGQTLEPES
ncbi:uncharacterized protein LOC133796176 [Humulus lupulus]|uniref:uncharacterized protein LOC133796176 n=1 Tax=Humulus lupulus TaxID=3486 RepID=UPI002B40C6CC|nr:uncharacterized protein LOC133796176 [Humulus lupulus]